MTKSRKTALYKQIHQSVDNACNGHTLYRERIHWVRRSDYISQVRTPGVYFEKEFCNETVTSGLFAGRDLPDTTIKQMSMEN